MTVFNTKLGKTRAGERTRIWIEGTRLVEAGFTVGSHFERVWRGGVLTLMTATKTHFDNLPVKERGTVSGKGDHPIIDITGQLVSSTFGIGTHVAVEYSAGRIVITAAT